MRRTLPTFAAVAATAALIVTGAAPASAVIGVLDTIKPSAPDQIVGAYDLAVTEDWVYVSARYSDEVVFIDPETHEVGGRVTVGDEPTRIIPNPAGTKAYVVNASSNSISVITTATNTVTNTIPVGTYPADVAFSADGSVAYVTNYGANSISRIDTSTETATVISPAGENFQGFPAGIAFSADESRLYLTETNTDSVGVYTIATNTYDAGAILVGDFPNEIELSADGTKAYVSNSGDGVADTVSEIDLVAGQETRTVLVGGFVTDVVVGADVLYAASNTAGIVAEIDPITFAAEDTVGVPQATSLAIAPDGTVWVTQPSLNSVSVVGTEVDRLAGTDRYRTAVEVSQAAYPSGAPIAYVATGTNYPDALSAGPAAAAGRLGGAGGGPLLLTAPGALPDAVAAELERLNPAEIVVLGGSASVSAAVVTQLQSIAPTTRIAGESRYASGIAVVRDSFATEPIVYLATGQNFPDALSAGAAGAELGIPVILVNGASPSVDAATLDLLDDLSVTTVKILGGNSAVSAGIQSQLDALYDVVRLSGANRFETSTAINDDAFASADHAVFATGYNFPDALAGATYSSSIGAPLFVVPGSCVPDAMLTSLEMKDVARVTLLGGAASLPVAIEALPSC